MHGKRPEHPEVFKARMQHHKDLKKDQPKEDAPKDGGSKAPDKKDDAATAKRKAAFQHKAKDAAKHDQRQPAKGVLTHLLPNQ